MILAKFLGHQSLNTLRYYAKFEVSDLKELVDLVFESKQSLLDFKL